MKKVYYLLLRYSPKPIAYAIEKSSHLGLSFFVLNIAPLLAKTQAPLRRLCAKLIIKKLEQRTPAFILKDLKWLAHIEPELEPTPYLLLQLKKIDEPDFSRLGYLYQEVYAACATQQYGTLLLTDTVLDFKRLNASKQPVLLLLTKKNKKTDKLDLPDNISVFELGQHIGFLPLLDQEIILVRLILQLNISKVTILNSRLGIMTLKKYSKAFSNTIHQETL